MERIVLKGRARRGHGSASSRRARRDGWVPANLYGHGEANFTFYVRHEEIARCIANEHHLMTIDVDGKQDSGLIKELQFDTFGDHIIHVDFARVSLDEVIETSVSVHLAGNAKGVSSGGVLDLQHHEILLRGKARDIPENIEIDVTDLAIGDAVRVGDLTFPAGVEALIGEEEPVVAIQAPIAETEPTEGEEGAEGETAAE